MRAIANGSVDITNPVIGKGASFAINLRVTAEVDFTEGKKIKSNSALAGNVANKIMRLLKKKEGLEINVRSELPKSSGLGYNESLSTAAALAVTALLAKKYGSIFELRVDRYMTEQFVTVDDRIIDKRKLIELCSSFKKNSFDRLISSFYGGFAITDNKKMDVLRRGEMESLHCVMFECKESPESLLKEGIEIAWNEALKGNIYTAMKLNATLLLQDKKMIEKILKTQALAFALSDNSLICLTRDRNRVSGIKKSLNGKFIFDTTNEEARILSKPRKIVKMKEFLELKKDSDFHWL